MKDIYLAILAIALITWTILFLLTLAFIVGYYWGNRCERMNDT